MKTYKIENNHMIVSPGTPYEEDITESCRECEYCIYSPKTCGHTDSIGQFCDWMTFPREYTEVFDD